MKAARIMLCALALVTFGLTVAFAAETPSRPWQDAGGCRDRSNPSCCCIDGDRFGGSAQPARANATVDESTFARPTRVSSPWDASWIARLVRAGLI